MEQKNVVEIKVRTVIKFTAAAWFTWKTLNNLDRSLGRLLSNKNVETKITDATHRFVEKVVPEEDSKPASGNKKTVRVDSKKS